MLVLARRPGESLKLGDDIEITVLKVSASGVSLGIKAPRSLAVLRGELAAAVLNENRSAAESAPSLGALEEISRAMEGQAEETDGPEGKQEGRVEGKQAGAGDRPGRTEARPKASKRRRE